MVGKRIEVCERKDTQIINAAQRTVRSVEEEDVVENDFPESLLIVSGEIHWIVGGEAAIQSVAREKQKVDDDRRPPHHIADAYVTSYGRHTIASSDARVKSETQPPSRTAHPFRHERAADGGWFRARRITLRP